MIKQFLSPFLSYKYLLNQLVKREIKARYKQSILGYAWILINPLLQLLVYSFVFSIIFRFPTNNIPYPIFLLVGLLPWIYFQTSISTSTLILVDNADLLRKVYFPREVFIYGVIMSKAVDLLFASLVLIIFMLFFRISLSINILWIFPIFIVQVVLITGISLIISTLNLFYRDIQYLTNLILLMWMYLTPIVYSLSLVPEKYLWIYRLNPMVGIIKNYRSAVFNSPFDIPSIIFSIFISLIVFVFGFWLFKKSEKVFADIV